MYMRIYYVIINYILLLIIIVITNDIDDDHRRIAVWPLRRALIAVIRGIYRS